MQCNLQVVRQTTGSGKHDHLKNPRWNVRACNLGNLPLHLLQSFTYQPKTLKRILTHRNSCDNKLNWSPLIYLKEWKEQAFLRIWLVELTQKNIHTLIYLLLKYHGVSSSPIAKQVPIRNEAKKMDQTSQQKT